MDIKEFNNQSNRNKSWMTPIEVTIHYHTHQPFLPFQADLYESYPWIASLSEAIDKDLVSVYLSQQYDLYNIVQSFEITYFFTCYDTYNHDIVDSYLVFPVSFVQPIYSRKRINGVTTTVYFDTTADTYIISYSKDGEYHEEHYTPSEFFGNKHQIKQILKDLHSNK